MVEKKNKATRKGIKATTTEGEEKVEGEFKLK